MIDSDAHDFSAMNNKRSMTAAIIAMGWQKRITQFHNFLQIHHPIIQAFSARQLTFDIFLLSFGVNLKREKLLERITKLEKEVQELQDVVKLLYYMQYPHKFEKTDCKGIFLKKNK